MAVGREGGHFLPLQISYLSFAVAEPQNLASNPLGGSITGDAVIMRDMSRREFLIFICLSLLTLLRSTPGSLIENDHFPVFSESEGVSSDFAVGGKIKSSADDARVSRRLM
jgi:hypothetical protein